MKISTGGISISTSSSAADASSVVTKSAGGDPYPYQWSYNADGQDADGFINFSSTSGFIGGDTTNFSVVANAAHGGISFVAGSSGGHGGIQAPYWDIQFDHMNTVVNAADGTTTGGTSLQSDPLTNSIASNITHMTIVMSHYYQGTGTTLPISMMGPSAPGAGSGFMGLYWTNDSTADANYGDYTTAIPPESLNIESDMIYITFLMTGSVDASGAGETWGIGDVPLAITHAPFHTVDPDSGEGWVLHGLIGWNASTTAGNTSISLPIRTSK